ncbi:MAG: Hpt domain-containing protein [Desulfobacterales bacterium]
MQEDRPSGADSGRFAIDELTERVDGDNELIREVLEIFLEDTPSTLEALKTGISDQSPEAVARAAHTLKGASANIAANRLRDHAYQLELKAKSGDLADAGDIYADLAAEYAALKNHLNKYLA